MSCPTEHAEQKALITWANLQAGKHPELHLLYAIPNGGARSQATAGKLKAEGVKPGVPDLCLPAPRGNYHGLYIEMKRAQGSKTSPTQKWWHIMLIALGHHVVICKSSEEAQHALLAYLALPAKVALLNSPPPLTKTTPKKQTSKALVRDFRRAPTLAWTSPPGLTVSSNPGILGQRPTPCPSPIPSNAPSTKGNTGSKTRRSGAKSAS